MKTLDECRVDGKGLVLNFKEKANFKLEKDGMCPHCKNKLGVNYSAIQEKYEIPSDVEFMNSGAGYSWTEDLKCPNCGKLYSRNNGC